MMIFSTIPRVSLIVVVALSLAVTQPLQLFPPQQEVPDSYFGMHIHGIDVPRPYNHRVTPWPSVPFGSWRLMDAYVRWYDVEPHKNQFDFARLDKYVSLAQEKRVRILLPLFGSPPWASARPKEVERGIPAGASAEPGNMDDWRDFVRAVATRYRGHIEGYEVWNEPNLKQFWTGTVEQLVTITRDAYQIVKSIDPNAIVVSPSCTTDSGPAYLESFLQKGGGQYVDVIGYHFYVNTKPPETMVEVARRVKDILRANHVDKPVWNTETGAEDAKVLPTAESAAAWVARALIVVWAAGVRRFYWYSWDNHVYVEMVERDDVTQKQTARAYYAVHDWLVGAVMRSCQLDSAAAWTCELRRGDSPQWIVWKPDGPGKFSIPSDWNVAHASALLGSREIVKDAQIDIGPAPILLER